MILQNLTGMDWPEQMVNKMIALVQRGIQNNEPEIFQVIRGSRKEFQRVSEYQDLPHYLRKLLDILLKASQPAKKRKRMMDMKNREEDQCSICLCIIKRNTMIPLLKCRHKFHKKCLKSWLKRSPECPYCKQIIQKIENTI